MFFFFAIYWSVISYKLLLLLLLLFYMSNLGHNSTGYYDYRNVRNVDNYVDDSLYDH